MANIRKLSPEMHIQSNLFAVIVRAIIDVISGGTIYTLGHSLPLRRVKSHR